MMANSLVIVMPPITVPVPTLSPPPIAVTVIFATPDLVHQWEDFAFTDEFLSAYPQFAPITVKIHRDGEFLGEL